MLSAHNFCKQFGPRSGLIWLSHSNALLLVLHSIFVSSQIKVLQAACHPMKFDLNNDVKLLLTVLTRGEFNDASAVGRLLY